MRIATNVSALNSWRNLTITDAALSKTLERLSSGYRINRAADDAAGLAISEKMRGQIAGLNMAVKNAQDGISLIQTGEGALNEVHAMLKRMEELAVQASNDTNTAEDRAKLQSEMDQLAQEVARIGSTTEFNTLKLLDGSFAKAVKDIAFHIGANEDQNLRINIDDMRSKAIGVAGAEASIKGESTGAVTNGTNNYIADGASGSVSLNEVTGQYELAVDAAVDASVTNGTTYYIDDAESGTVAQNTSTGNYELTVQVTDGSTNTEGVTLVSTDGGKTFSGTTTTSGETIEVNFGSAAVTSGTVTFADSGGAGAPADEATATGTLTLVSSDGTSFSLTGVGGSGETITVDFSSALGPITSGQVTFADTDADTTNGAEAATGTTEIKVDNDGLEAAVYTVDTDGVNWYLRDQNLNIVGVSDDGMAWTKTDGTTALFTTTVALVDATQVEVGGIDISSDQTAANKALGTIQTALETVSSQRSLFGATQNRLEHTINNLQVASENLSAAESRIRDVDMAAEMANFTRNQILQQTGTAMLAQANAAPQTVLQLLR